jgi:hypothetical protein
MLTTLQHGGSVFDALINIYFGGCKFEAQRALVIDETPLRVF